MPSPIRTQHAHGRLVAVAPGLVDVVLAGPAEPLLLQLAFATEHRFRVEVRADGHLPGARGRIEADFVVSPDGAIAEYGVALYIHSEGGDPS
ncbi:MAG TPA: hypothetical protein VM266_13230 [Solirubrobacteraceae bacterium]|nr:hypothetical protein [Solirubrobacteraceae bacterium]